LAAKYTWLTYSGHSEHFFTLYGQLFLTTIIYDLGKCFLFCIL